MHAVDPQLVVNRPVSLLALLISRECRQSRQQARHQCTLLVLTLVVPGVGEGQRVNAPHL